ncbi:MAG TPA: hypothetical protein PKO25_14260 [Spirochaetota bacterium]|nr:hypothetical protein [Spirochaetota bacterium]HNU93033.1 hypothetical protein [Spirochaetota bacterium]HPV98202.1 hypothetical protein [Spirochaetota bacterium]
MSAWTCKAGLVSTDPFRAAVPSAGVYHRHGRHEQNDDSEGRDYNGHCDLPLLDMAVLSLTGEHYADGSFPLQAAVSIIRRRLKDKAVMEYSGGPMEKQENFATILRDWDYTGDF